MQPRVDDKRLRRTKNHWFHKSLVVLGYAVALVVLLSSCRGGNAQQITEQVQPSTSIYAAVDVDVDDPVHSHEGAVTMPEMGPMGDVASSSSGGVDDAIDRKISASLEEKEKEEEEKEYNLQPRDARIASPSSGFGEASTRHEREVVVIGEAGGDADVLHQATSATASADGVDGEDNAQAFGLKDSQAVNDANAKEGFVVTEGKQVPFEGDGLDFGATGHVEAKTTTPKGRGGEGAEEQGGQEEEHVEEEILIDEKKVAEKCSSKEGKHDNQADGASDDVGAGACVADGTDGTDAADVAYGLGGWVSNDNGHSSNDGELDADTPGSGNDDSTSGGSVDDAGGGAATATSAKEQLSLIADEGLHNPEAQLNSDTPLKPQYDLESDSGDAETGLSTVSSIVSSEWKPAARGNEHQSTDIGEPSSATIANASWQNEEGDYSRLEEAQDSKGSQQIFDEKYDVEAEQTSESSTVSSRRQYEGKWEGSRHDGVGEITGGVRGSSYGRISGGATGGDGGMGFGRGSPEELAQRVRDMEAELMRKILAEEDAKTLLDIWVERAREYILTQTVPPTDSECDFNWRRFRCEPKCSCGSRLHFGDYTPGRACRLLHHWERNPVCEDTWDPSDEPAVKRLAKAVASALGSARRAYDERVAPPTDAECSFNMETRRCEPQPRCRLRFRWGDLALSSACRLIPEEIPPGGPW